MGKIMVDNKDQHGIAHVWIVIVIVLVLAAIGFAGSRVYKMKSGSEKSFTTINPKTGKAEKVTWSRTQDGFSVSGTPPACPEPLLKMPVDISKVTEILYPGQVRGGNYKPHGGFSFSNKTDNKVAVTAPLDAQLAYASRYIEIGEVQYMLDFIHPCGFMYRFDHLKTLSPKFQAVADKLPQPKEGDSRTQPVGPGIEVKAGEIVASEIGFSIERLIVGVDFGVYDMRSPNEVSKNSAWSSTHPYTNERYAVCWFDLLPPEDAAKIRALPASDGQSGKNSDYCKTM